MEIFKEIKNCVSHNAAFKISAVVLSAMVWFYFFAERERLSFRIGSGGSLTAPVQVLDHPHSHYRARINPPAVEISARGPREILRNLDPEDLKVFVETKGLASGVYYLPVRVFTPLPVAIVSRTPSHVEVTIRERWTGGSSITP